MNVLQDQPHFGIAEDDWQLLLARGTHQVERRPGALQGVLIEELDAGQRNSAVLGAPRSTSVRWRKPKVPQFGFGELVGRLVIMSRQLPDSRQVRLLRSGREDLQAQVFAYVFS